MKPRIFLLALAPLLLVPALRAAQGIKDVTFAGTMSGTPTGGVLDLSHLTLTLPDGMGGGGDWQPHDATLDLLSGLPTTTFGRARLNDVNAAAARTVLGLGTLATQSGTFSGTSSGINTGDQDLSGLLVKANNLSDLPSASIARTNLGLGTLATQSGTFSGTSSGTNTGDQDLSGLLVKANNLSDLTSASTARTNLGLGTLATQSGTFSGTHSGSSSGTNTGDQDLSGLLVKASNLSDLTSASTARTNLGVAIGSNVQAYSANLTTFAGIAPSANIQTFLGAADNAAARTALGLGTLATQSGTFSGSHSGTSSGTNTGDQTSVTGNAGTATALQTARTINGVSFDGTGNITVSAAAGTLTGSTLASGVTASSLTSAAGGNFSTGAYNLQTILTGTAGQLTVSNGGIGNTTLSLPSALTGINSITAGASTDLTLSGGSGSTKVTTASPLTTSNTTTSTNTTSGALIVSGGAGIGGAVFAGGNVTTSGTINSVITGATASFTAYRPLNNYPRASFNIGNSSSDNNALMIIAPLFSSAGVQIPGGIVLSTNKDTADSTSKQIDMLVTTTQSLIDSSSRDQSASGTAGNPIYFRIQPSGSTTPTVGLIVNNDASNTITLGKATADTAAQLNVTARNSLYAATFSSGNVGIGTTSPSALLTVAGAATITGTVIHSQTATPASASATGTTGTIAWDSSYIYICVATNTWKRVAIATW